MYRFCKFRIDTYMSLMYLLQAGVDNDGHIKAIDVDLYCNGGYSLDHSQNVSEFSE